MPKSKYLAKVTPFIAAQLIAKRRSFLFCSLIAVIIAVIGIPRLGFNGDFQQMFAPSNSDLQQFSIIQSTYENSEKTIFMVKPIAGTFLKRSNLQALHTFTERLWQFPYSLSVTSLTNFQHLTSTNDTLLLSPLLPNINDISQQQLDTIHQLLQQNSAPLASLLSRDKSVATIIVDLALPSEPLERLPAIKQQEQFTEDLSQFIETELPGTTFHHIGGPALEWALLDVVSKDALILLPICIALCLGILGLLLGSVISVVGTMLTIIVSVLTTMGLAGWMGYELSPLSLSAPTMVMLLAMADSIHLLTQYTLERKPGLADTIAMEKSISANLKPIFLTSVATAVGFMSVNFSDSPGFHDFANITSIGVLIALLVTLFILPSISLYLTSAFLPTDSQRNVRSSPLPAKVWMRQIGEWVVSKHRWLFWSILITTPIVILQIKHLEIDDDITGYLSDDLPFKQSVNFSNDHFFGFHHIIYSLDTGVEQGINNLDFLNNVDNFQVWLKKQAGVNQVHSYTDILKQINHIMLPQPSGEDRLPQSRELASQYLLLYELALPDSNSLHSMINLDRSAIRIVVTLNAIPNKQLLNIQQQSLVWLEQNVQSVDIHSGSRSLMFANIGNVIFESMIIGTVFALLCISFLIVMGIRSLRFGIISLLPNITPPAIVFGAWAIAVGHVNQTAAIIFSVSLGLVVDDTIHFLCKYLEGRKLGYSAEKSIIDTFENVGVALFITSTALCVGLCTLVFSSFIPNVTTAIMLASIIATALAFDFFFLPPLLILFEKLYPYTSTAIQPAAPEEQIPQAERPIAML
ncbi:hypothetical protein A9Q99_26865 [Gammaproteobacteria bacterium 45_16_T64]|nr:hypothetical protein A9Q99_26865 [Gammaproteobacteria bacterium 45_16_T64]